MLNDVRAFCRKEQLVQPGDTLICAVSGGVDSVVLLHMMCRLQSELCVRVCAAHFNHHLRAEEADRDEAFVRSLCQSLGVPLFLGGADVAARAAQTGESIEESARKLRYAFFDTLDGIVATAHSADDNLETVLLNLLRGTALAGLCGIAPKRGRYVRPLLCLTRSQIEQYALENGLSHVEDSTNALDCCVRNRLRHHVVPLLKQENPALSESVLRMSALLREDERQLQLEAEELLQRAAVSDGYRCEVLRQASSCLRTRALRLLLQQIHAPKLSAVHILAAERLVCGEDPSARCCLPGDWVMQREYDSFCLKKGNAPQPTFSPVRLNPDGVTEIPALGLRVTCKRGKKSKDFEKSLSTFAFKCDTIDAGGALWLRPRQPGDSLRLRGGTRSLRRLLIDRRIPAAKRDLLPVLADEQGVLAVYPLAVNLERLAGENECAIIITIEKEDMRRYD